MGITSKGIKFSARVKGFIPADMSDMESFMKAGKRVEEIKALLAGKSDIEVVGDFKSTVGSVIVGDDGNVEEDQDVDDETAAAK